MMAASTTKAITLSTPWLLDIVISLIEILVGHPRFKLNSLQIRLRLSWTADDASGATRSVAKHRGIESHMADFEQQIKLPSGYYFGISAASADTPDSFEIYKFVTSSAPGVTRELPRRDPPAQQPPQGGQTNDQGSQQASSNGQFAVQFTELQNRLSTLSQSLDNVFREVQSLSAKSDARHQDLSNRVSSNQQLSAIDQKIQSIENTVRGFQGQFSNIQGMMKDSHSTLNEGLTEHMTHSKYKY